MIFWLESRLGSAEQTVWSCCTFQETASIFRCRSNTTDNVFAGPAQTRIAKHISRRNQAPEEGSDSRWQLTRTNAAEWESHLGNYYGLDDKGKSYSETSDSSVHSSTAQSHKPHNPLTMNLLQHQYPKAGHSTALEQLRLSRRWRRNARAKPGHPHLSYTIPSALCLFCHHG